MLILIAAVLWSSLAIVILLFTIRQFRVIERLHILAEAPAKLPPLSVIVPVRNEVVNVERCLTTLLAQDYSDLEIIVVDDDSTDSTVDIVRRVAAEDPRVRVIVAPPLAPGWKGKSNACWCGSQVAHGEWLCFIDGDTAPSAPQLLSSVIAQVQRTGLDMVSCQPFQELGTFWERIIYPAGFILLLLLLDVKRINDPSKPDAAANGQFLVIRRAVYHAVGGHQNESVRGQFVEDVALATVVKKAGYRLSLMVADNAIRTRMYTGLHDMWNGFFQVSVRHFSRHSRIHRCRCRSIVRWVPASYSASADLVCVGPARLGRAFSRPRGDACAAHLDRNILGSPRLVRVALPARLCDGSRNSSQRRSAANGQQRLVEGKEV